MYYAAAPSKAKRQMISYLGWMSTMFDMPASKSLKASLIRSPASIRVIMDYLMSDKLYQKAEEYIDECIQHMDVHPSERDRRRAVESVARYTRKLVEALRR